MKDFLKSIPHKFNKTEAALLEKALEFARQAHAGQKRNSGEPFVNHPIQAAVILGQIFPDATTIAATLLHDITEDTKTTGAQLAKEFGAEIASLVDGVTKLGRVRLLNSTDEFYIENLRKMFIATSKDLRVMLIKLADRLHNMRTIKYLPQDKQVKVASETLEMYSPIAGRLGIGSWKAELADLAFRVVYPKEYEETKKLLEQEMRGRELKIKDLEKELATTLRTEGIKFMDIAGRQKRIYSLYNKLQRYQDDTTKIYDIIALRIITKSTSDCYAALGIIHKHFQPVPGRIKDYISAPKPNGYQSLHTSVFDRNGHVFEVQLRTDLMEEAAERGIAAHWFYEEKGKPDENVARPRAKWVKELRSWQELTSGNPEEFLESLKIDFFKDRIFVLTPRGDVKDLPVSASVIDFAFAVHTDLGLYMMGAKVNGKMASIYSPLKQGDVVEILKAKKLAVISRDWLEAARSSHARSQIRSYLRQHDRGIIQRVRELKLQDFQLPKFFRKK